MKAPEHLGGLYVYGCGDHPNGMRYMVADHPDKLRPLREREVYPVTAITRWVRDAEVLRAAAAARMGVAVDLRRKIAELLSLYPERDYSLAPLRELDAYLCGCIAAGAEGEVGRG